jgi:hypothetical protein
MQRNKSWANPVLIHVEAITVPNHTEYQTSERCTDSQGSISSDRSVRKLFIARIDRRVVAQITALRL